MPLPPLEQPRRRGEPPCPICQKSAEDCQGGCYYSPGRIEILLGQLPNSTQTVTNPNNYGKSRRTHANPMESNWAIRADVMRALDHVAASAEDGPVTRQIVWLAYVGEPTDTPPGRTAGLSTAAIALKLGMDRRTVERRRGLGIRLMVECLNPEYRWSEAHGE